MQVQEAQNQFDSDCLQNISHFWQKSRGKEKRNGKTANGNKNDSDNDCNSSVS